MYVIMLGEYSDKEPIGYVQTEEEAKKFCAKYNELYYSDDEAKLGDILNFKNAHSDEDICSWYLPSCAWYTEINELDTDNIEVEPMQMWEVGFLKYYDGWRNVTCRRGDLGTKNMDSIFDASKDGKILVTIATNETDEEVIKKIAQDKLYQYLAEKQYLGV